MILDAANAVIVHLNFEAGNLTGLPTLMQKCNLSA
jgi:hypothetical protein